MKAALFSLIMLLSTKVNAQPYDGHHMGWDMFGYGYGGLLMWLLLIVLVVVVVYFIFRQQTVGRSSTTNETPLEILKKRYARGEISKEEYDRMKNDLL